MDDNAPQPLNLKQINDIEQRTNDRTSKRTDTIRK